HGLGIPRRRRAGRDHHHRHAGASLYRQPLKTALTSKEEKMKSIKQKAGLLLSTAALILALPLGSAQAEGEKVTIAVSIPAATHGWTGGVVYHAEQAEKEIEAAFPNIDVVLSTASSAP